MKIEYVHKSVIENRILAALESDENTVAILATKQDLETFLEIFRIVRQDYIWFQIIAETKNKIEGLAKDMKELKQKAFP